MFFSDVEEVLVTVFEGYHISQEKSDKKVINHNWFALSLRHQWEAY